ncbi:hypothetical protein EV283_0813 [Sphingomonas sp. BK036]|uniref:hypothetical protein n=1 Tax=Sphingomonas sp. BK036 TaxID=2512122 RepID=UPI001029AB3F|nr:hypothetical protein [Sphingomonas sp. BK036]RZT56758.1 hypothetical protein EV283_0813 [Sphingomonas sp. BK036]
MGPVLWSASGGLAALAVVAGFGERRRRRRRDPDSVGWVDWPTVQMLALIALAVMIGLAVKS